MVYCLHIQFDKLFLCFLILISIWAIAKEWTEQKVGFKTRINHCCEKWTWTMCVVCSCSVNMNKPHTLLLCKPRKGYKYIMYCIARGQTWNLKLFGWQTLHAKYLQIECGNSFCNICICIKKCVTVFTWIFWNFCTPSESFPDRHLSECNKEALPLKWWLQLSQNMLLCSNEP